VIDGRDISPLLFGQTKESQREAHYYFSSYNLQAVRQGPWKLALMTQGSAKNKGTVEDDAKVNPRLYNLADEIGEVTNVAAQHPDIVAKLTALAEKMSAEIGGNEPKARRPAGEATNPVTMYPTEDDARSRKKADSKKNNAKPVALEALKPGDTLTSDVAPQVGKKSFTVICEVATKQTDAIILAHGGASTGYALHLSGGKLIWALKNGKSFTQTTTAFTSDGKPQHVTASLAKDGTMTLRVNDQEPVTAKAPSLLGTQPKEDFCLGHDNKVPVATYTTKGKFEGKITQLSIGLGK
jgi:hypothetical protein